MSWYETPGAEQDVVLCTTAGLARDIARYPFPSRMSATEARELLTAVGATLTENGFSMVDFADIPRTTACSLVEKGYATPEFMRTSLPHALYLNEPCGISVMLCGQDHVRLRCICAGLAVRDAYAGAAGVESQLDAAFPFAFTEALGYLTQSPGELGTGLRISVLLYLPALRMAGQVRGLAAHLESRGLSLCGTDGTERDEPALYRLSNRVTLGLSEIELAERVENAARELILCERRRRAALSGDDLERLTDRVFRALGAARYARSVDASECLEWLSLLRLGAAMGLLPDVRVEHLTSLLFDQLPATLALSEEPPLLDTAAQNAARARVLRERLA